MESIVPVVAVGVSLVSGMLHEITPKTETRLRRVALGLTAVSLIAILSGPENISDKLVFFALAMGAFWGAKFTSRWMSTGSIKSE